MTDLYVDPAHRVPDDQWAQVVRDANAFNAAHLAVKTGGASSPAGPLINMLGSGKHSGVSGIPTQLLVLHSGECPLRGGFAQSLTQWANTPIDAGGPIASWHWFIDPIARVRMIEEVYAAWHASEANPISEGFEQAGYARFTRAEWLTPDGLLQMESLAFTMAQRAKANNIPARWLTDAEVVRATSGDRTVKGLCLHRQIDPETRTDPGDGYPYDLLLAKIKAYMGATTTTKDEFDMATVSEVVKALWNTPVRRVVNGKTVEVSALQELADAKTMATKAAAQSAPIIRGGKEVSLRQEVADCKTMLLAQEELIKSIAGRQGIDPAEVERILSEAAAKALAKVSLVTRYEQGDAEAVAQ